MPIPAFLLGVAIFSALLLARPTEATAQQPQCSPPQTLSPSNPSKEYIYLAGRLIATEEPGNCNAPPVSNTPVITSLSRFPAGTSPNGAAPGESFTLTIQGSNLGTANAVNFTPTNIIGVSNVVPSTDGTQVAATINVPQSAPLGSYDVSVSTTTPQATSNVLQFFVTLPGAPAISNLNPQSVIAGSPTLRVSVTGAGFNSASLVLVNGVGRAPVTVIGGTLQFDFSQSELALPGSLDISVANPEPGNPGNLVASNSLAFTINTPPVGPPNPMPTLTSLVPSSVIAGNPVLLNVSGSGLISSTLILVNGIARGTVSTGVQLTQADVAHAGSLRVSAFNPAPGGGLSNTLSLPIVPPSTYFALSLDGGSWVRVPNNPALNLSQADGSFTVEAWVKTTSTTTQGIVEHYTIGATSGSNSGGFALRMLGSGKVRFFIFQNDTAAGTDAITSPATALVNDGSWHHVAGVFAANAPAPGTPGEPGVMTLYIDGQPVASSTMVGFTARSPQPSTTDLFLGAISGGSQPLNGEIDGVRVSSAAIYTSQFDPNQQAVQIPTVTSTTVGLWTFDNQDLTDSANFATPPGALNGQFVTTGTLTAPVFLKNAPGAPPSANSILLDGGSWVLVPSDPTLDITTAFTVEAWIKPANTSSQQAIVERYPATSGTGGGFALDLLPGGNISFAVYRGTTNFDSVNSTNSITDTNWHHVAGVYDGANINIYLDGSLAGTAASRTPRSSTANLLIGGSQIRGTSGTAGFFTGKIDEVRLSTGTLYTGAGPGLSGIPTSLTAASSTMGLWKFDDLTLKDSSQNHNDGIRKRHVVFSSDVPGATATNFVTEDFGTTDGFDLLGLLPASATQGNPQFSLQVAGSYLTGAASVSVTPPTSGTPVTAALASSSTSGQVNLTVNPVSLSTPPGAYLITLYDSGNNPLGSIVFTVNQPQPNPVPFLSSLFPANVQAGSPGFQLQVSGGNFIHGSVVLANGSARVTQFVDAGTLTAQILSTDIASLGSVAIQVSNPPSGGGGGGLTAQMPLNVQGPASNPMPFVTSLSPSSAQTSTAPIRLRVLGKNFVNSSQIVFNGVLRTDTSFVSSNELDVTLSNNDIVNPGSQPISIPVEVNSPAPGGGITPPTQFTVNPVNPVPTVAGISPTSATTGGAGFTLTVNGTGFVNGASTVRLNAAGVSTSFVSSTQLNAQIPGSAIASPGSASVDVVSTGPGGGTSNPVTLTISAQNNPVPVVTSVAPSSVQVDSAGQAVVVTGSNFISGTVVLVNGSPRPTTFNSSDPTHLSAQLSTSDFAVLSQLAIKAFNPEPGGGQSAAVNLTVFAPAPTFTSISPTSVTAGNGATPVTLAGTNFIDESVVQVNGTPHAAVLNSSTQLTVTFTATEVAAGAQLPITVTNPGPSGGTTAAITFTVNNPIPSLDGSTPLTPSSVTAGSTTPVVVSVLGTNFNPSSQISVNGRNEATDVDATHLNLTLQPSDIAIGKTISVAVFNPPPMGGTSGTATLTVNSPVPALDPNTPLTPASVLVGSLTGTQTQTITIKGTNFLPNSQVNYNNVFRATTFVDSSHLTITVNASDVAGASTVPVFVFNPAPAGGNSGTVNFQISNPVPAVTGLDTPAVTTTVNPLPQITVLGSNFVIGATAAASATAQIGTGVQHSPLAGSDSGHLIIQLTAADVSTAGSYAVTVTNPGPGGGASTTSTTFTAYNPPVITSLSPNSATVGQKTPPLVTVNGSNFLPGSVVTLNGASHTPTSASTATQLFIQLTLDPDLSLPAGSYQMTVITPVPGGVSAPNANSVFILNNPPPSGSSLNPAAVTTTVSPLPTLTIQGTGFVVGSTPAMSATVQIGTGAQHAVLAGSDSSHLIIQLAAADVATAGSYQVTITNPPPGGGTSTVPTAFTVYNPPVITSLSPNNATVGQQPPPAVTVSGTGFLPGSVVILNNVVHTPTSINSQGTQLVIQLTLDPDLTLAAGSYPVTVNTPVLGGISAAGSFTLLNPAPAGSSLNPPAVTTGMQNPPQLEILGSGFVVGSTPTASATVQIGTGAQHTILAGSDSSHLFIQLTSADVATAGSYSVTVTNPPPSAGPSTVPTPFTVYNPPVITSLAPNSAIVGQQPPPSVTVNGSGFLSGSVVTLNGASHTPTSINSQGTQLVFQLTLDPDLSLAAGTYPVAVVTPVPAGTSVQNANSVFTLNNPVPQMSTSNPLSPASVTAGSGAASVTITGSGFVKSSIVNINGQGQNPNNVTYVSSSQLQLTIPASQTATPATMSVVVSNIAPGGGSSNTAVFTVGNPAPTLTTLTPGNVTAGGTTFTLTVNGTSFVNGAAVQVNGSSRSTNFASSTQLTATIPASDITSAGTLAITVLNPAPGGGASPSVGLPVVAPSTYAGYLDTANCSIIGGWAWSSALPNTPINVDIYNGSALLATVPANLFRSDLPGAGIGNGYHAFSLATPSSLQDGTTHTVSAKFGGTSISLSSSPKLLSCGPSPVPSISSISPASVTAGSAGFTLTVNGSGFVSGSTVRVNGSNRTTTLVSATQLTVAIPASDLASAGTLSITVFNPAPGGGTSAVSSFTVNAANNPLPSISSVSPSNIFAGGSDFTLTITGSGFISSSVVNVAVGNGSGTRATTFVSSTQLTVQITSSDISTSGTQITISVTNPSPGGGTSNQVTLNVQ